MGNSDSFLWRPLKPQDQQHSEEKEKAHEPSKEEDGIGEADKAFKGEVPHKYEYILKDADSPLDKPSRWGKQLNKLYNGVFLNGKTKKYWVEKTHNANCFMLYARALSITWGENSQYWQWVQHKEERSDTTIEVAKLIKVCWLEVRGKFDAEKLSPGITYQVSFIVMLKNSGDGWENPINFRLVLPSGNKVEKRECLMEKRREIWTEIPVGEFQVSKNDVGEMEISMYEFDSGKWKSGLLIKGVCIKPKN